MTSIHTIMQEVEKSLQGDTKVVDFRPGDTVVVSVKVREGTRERIQDFEGVVIARRNNGFNSSFTVRKISYGEGVERTFHLYSKHIHAIKVTRQGKVRRAKLYYLRELSGRKARIKERIDHKPKSKEKKAKASKASSSNKAKDTASKASTDAKKDSK